MDLVSNVPHENRSNIDIIADPSTVNDIESIIENVGANELYDRQYTINSEAIAGPSTMIDDVEVNTQQKTTIDVEPTKELKKKRTTRKKAAIEIPDDLVCTECSRQFKRRDHLKDHIKSQHSLEKAWYTCSVCSAGMGFPQNLKIHLKRTHGWKKEEADMEVAKLQQKPKETKSTKGNRNDKSINTFVYNLIIKFQVNLQLLFDVF